MDSELIQAIARGDVETVRTLVQSHKDANRKYGKLRLAPVHIAVWYGQVEVVRSLLEQGAWAYQECRYGYRPLHIAAIVGSVPICKLLATERGDINAGSVEGLTALHYAVWHGHGEVVEFLLNNGADPLGAQWQEEDHPKHKSDWSCLHLAVKRRDYAVAECLIDRAGVAVVTQEGREGLTPLHMAVLEADEAMISLMTRPSVISYEERLPDGAPFPISLAASAGLLNVVKLLISAESMDDTKAGWLYDEAVTCGREEVAKWFVSQGLVDPNTRTPLVARPSDRYPLHVAVWENDIDEVRRILREKGDLALWHRRLRNGWTPLHLAARLNRLEIAKILAKEGGKRLLMTKSWDMKHDTPMHLACGYGTLELVQALFQIGGREAVLRNNANCIDRAAWWLQYEVMKWLLEACGFDEAGVEAHTRNYPTSLIEAPLLDWHYLGASGRGLQLAKLLEEELGPSVESRQLTMGPTA